MAALFHEGCKQQPGHWSDMMRDFAEQFVWTAAMLPAILDRAVSLLHVSMKSAGRGSLTPPPANTIRTALEEFARGEKRRQVPAWPDGPELHTRFAAWPAALMRANGRGESRRTGWRLAVYGPTIKSCRRQP